MNTFTVLMDGTYTGGLWWLDCFDAESEPLSEFTPNAKDESVMDEYYTVRFPENVDGSSLLSQCDAVISYEAA